MKGVGTKMTAISLKFRTITDTVTYTVGIAEEREQKILEGTMGIFQN